MNNKDFLFAAFSFLLEQAAAVWATPKAIQSYRFTWLITLFANRQNMGNSDLLNHSLGTLQKTASLLELIASAEWVRYQSAVYG